MNVLLAGLAAGATMFALMWIPMTVTSGRRVKRRIAAVIEPRAAETPVSGEERTGVRGTLEVPFAATEARLSGTRLWRGLESLVERSDLPLRTVEALYATIAGSFAIFLIVVTLGAPVFGAVVVVVLALALARVALGIRISRRLRAFEEQLPEMLDALASALRAGHSFTQALAAVAAESEEPTAHELGRVIVETRLGRPVDDALADLGRRMVSKDLDFVLTAVSVQRQVGGSIAGLFETVSGTVRERQQFIRKLRGLTAMGRASATVLTLIPIGIGVFMSIINPAYMSPLFNTGVGRLMIVLGLGSMLIGTLWLKKIVGFKG